MEKEKGNEHEQNGEEETEQEEKSEDNEDDAEVGDSEMDEGSKIEEDEDDEDSEESKEEEEYEGGKVYDLHLLLHISDSPPESPGEPSYVACGRDDKKAFGPYGPPYKRL